MWQDFVANDNPKHYIQENDLTRWIKDNKNKIYRFLVFKKTFTPYEIREAFVDETPYEDTHYRFGKITEAIDLGDGKWFVGIAEVIDCELTGTTVYYNLSDIRIEFNEGDQYMLDEAEIIDEK